MRTLSEWLAFIESAHPTEIDMSLTRVRKVFYNLRLNFANTCVVTVAGTNGKGTTCRFIEQACLAAGKTVGVYSSPHIEQFNERIRVNGADIDDRSLCIAFNTVHEATQVDNESISLTYFEYATLCGLLIIAERNLDVCILEVGLGGRLDATNIVDANIGVITSIGLDHQNYLGNTTELIAGEKAGIIKPFQKVVVGYSAIHNSVQQILRQFKASYKLSGRDFGFVAEDRHKTEDVDYSVDKTASSVNLGYLNTANDVLMFDLDSALIPRQNIMTSLATLGYIADYFNSPEALLVSAHEIANLIASVSMPGRMQIMQTEPYILLDVAHNEDSAALLVERLKHFKYAKCHIVIGMLKDKNIEATIECLADLKGRWYCTDLPTSRGEKAQRIINAVERYQQQADSFNNVESALIQASQNADSNDMILIVGSFVLASQSMRVLKNLNKG